MKIYIKQKWRTGNLLRLWASKVNHKNVSTRAAKLLSAPLCLYNFSLSSPNICTYLPNKNVLATTASQQCASNSNSDPLYLL